jgi:hypothetical protein
LFDDSFAAVTAAVTVVIAAVTTVTASFVVVSVFFAQLRAAVVAITAISPLGVFATSAILLAAPTARVVLVTLSLAVVALVVTFVRVL